MKSYVVGFLFDTDGENVALIKKATPDWQENMFNGVGGHIEEGETPEEAIRREFLEEAGREIVEWEQFALVLGEYFELYCFRAEAEISELHYEGEEGVVGPEAVWEVLSRKLPTISNTPWLVSMAARESAHDWPFVVFERCGDKLQ